MIENKKFDVNEHGVCVNSNCKIVFDDKKTRSRVFLHTAMIDGVWVHSIRVSMDQYGIGGLPSLQRVQRYFTKTPKELMFKTEEDAIVQAAKDAIEYIQRNVREQSVSQTLAHKAVELLREIIKPSPRQMTLF